MHIDLYLYPTLSPSHIPDPHQQGAADLRV
jgi:hypothetical protein